MVCVCVCVREGRKVNDDIIDTTSVVIINFYVLIHTINLIILVFKLEYQESALLTCMGCTTDVAGPSQIELYISLH